MGISVFPEPSGAAATNDFIINKNNTTNNVFEMGRSFESGGYSVVVTGSTAYDIYLLDSTGSSVGYTNGTSIVATGAFESISALGLGTADTVAFTYNGPSTNATATGTETGAGAYLTSIIPSDLPQIDDTAIVVGGNFASDVAITFTSGTVELSAKNVVYSSSTALVVTRPDGLIEDNAPYDLVAVNPGVTPPSTTGAYILSGTVTAGTDPSFVTTSPILGAFPGSAFSSAILTSDSEGTVVSWQITSGALPPGLTLGTADGSIAGTVAGTATGTYTFTVEITDDGSNTNSASFDMPAGFVLSGGNSTVVGGTTYQYFTATDDLVWQNATTNSIEYLVIAGGGAGGSSGLYRSGGGGGGAGGVFIGTATIDGAGSATITVGAGGALDTSGNDSVVGFATANATAVAGGRGGPANVIADNGGSGGGGASSGNPGFGTGTAGQGNNGGPRNSFYGGGGGGGKAEAGSTDGATEGGDGADYGAWASAVGIIYDGGYFGGGGGGGEGEGTPDAGGAGGLGGGGIGSGNVDLSTAGSANSGGGGGGGAKGYGNYKAASTGGSGLVILKVL